MKKRILALLLATIMVIGTLAGCSNSGDSKDTTAGTTVGDETITPVVTDAPDTTVADTTAMDIPADGGEGYITALPEGTKVIYSGNAAFEGCKVVICENADGKHTVYVAPYVYQEIPKLYEMSISIPEKYLYGSYSILPYADNASGSDSFEIIVALDYYGKKSYYRVQGTISKLGTEDGNIIYDETWNGISEERANGLVAEVAPFNKHDSWIGKPATPDTPPADLIPIGEAPADGTKMLNESLIQDAKLPLRDLMRKHGELDSEAVAYVFKDKLNSYFYYEDIRKGKPSNVVIREGIGDLFWNIELPTTTKQLAEDYGLTILLETEIKTRTGEYVVYYGYGDVCITIYMRNKGQIDDKIRTVFQYNEYPNTPIFENQIVYFDQILESVTNTATSVMKSVQTIESWDRIISVEAYQVGADRVDNLTRYWVYKSDCPIFLVAHFYNHKGEIDSHVWLYKGEHEYTESK